MEMKNEAEILAETENLVAWRSSEEVGYIYHLELGNLSIHFLSDEWEELVILIRDSSSTK